MEKQSKVNLLVVLLLMALLVTGILILRKPAVSVDNTKVISEICDSISQLSKDIEEYKKSAESLMVERDKFITELKNLQNEKSSKIDAIYSGDDDFNIKLLSEQLSKEDSTAIGHSDSNNDAPTKNHK